MITAWQCTDKKSCTFFFLLMALNNTLIFALCCVAVLSCWEPFLCWCYLLSRSWECLIELYNIDIENHWLLTSCFIWHRKISQVCLFRYLNYHRSKLNRWRKHSAPNTGVWKHFTSRSVVTSAGQLQQYYNHKHKNTVHSFKILPVQPISIWQSIKTELYKPHKDKLYCCTVLLDWIRL